MVRPLTTALACSVFRLYSADTYVERDEDLSLLQKQDMAKHKMSSEVDAECAKGKKKCEPKPPTCASVTCAYGYENIGFDDPCGSECTQEMCCVRSGVNERTTTTTTTTEEPTCADFKCRRGYDHTGGSEGCGDRCSLAKCCTKKTTTTTTPEPTCEDFTCEAGYDHTGGDSKCGQGSQCTTAKCCTKKTTTTTTTPEPTCKDFTCEAGYDHTGGDDKCGRGQQCTTAKCCTKKTTTTTTTTIQPENCPVPEHPKICHVWGDPHISHLFYDVPGEGHYNIEQHRGRQLKGGGFPRVFEFHEVGVFTLAKQGDNEVQVFMAQGPGMSYGGVRYPYSASLIGVAVKLGDHIMHMIRDPDTKGSYSGSSGKAGYWAYGDRQSHRGKDLYNLFVDGAEKRWSAIGPKGHQTDPTKNTADQVPVTARGEPISNDAYISQLVPTGSALTETVQPICMGTKDFTVDFLMKYSGTGQAAFTGAVTAFATNPDVAGICGDPAMKKAAESGPSPGYFGRGQGGENEGWQVAPENMLFTSKQLMDLCVSANMEMVDGRCGMSSIDVSKYHDVDRDAFCQMTTVGKGAKAEGYTIAQAVEDCKDMPESWIPVCELEMCASGGAGMEGILLEEQLEEFYTDKSLQ